MLQKISALMMLGMITVASGCEFVGNAIGVDWCPVWTPIKWVFGLFD